MSKYTEFDAKVLELIGTGTDTFTGLSCRLAEAAKPFTTGQPTWRVVDRRLQALRKAGKIRYAKGVWEVVGE